MDVVRVQESKRGNSFVPIILKDKPKVISKANLIFSPGGISLKLGRYNKMTGKIDTDDPRSELSLDDDELSKLVELLKNHYNLVLLGRGEYIKTSEDLNENFFKKLKGIFDSKEKKEVVEFFLQFWNNQLDHGNLVPHSDLIKAITQTQSYLIELERTMDSVSTRRRLSDAYIVKPRATLIFGRSSDWGAEKRESLRVLNAAYHSLTILTYDHVLQRAKRMAGIKEVQ